MRNQADKLHGCVDCNPGRTGKVIVSLVDGMLPLRPFRTQREEQTMAQLTDVQKSQIRRQYEELGPHQGALGSSRDRVFTAKEIRDLFALNDADPSRWPTFTDLNDHLRNVATLRRMGWSHNYSLT
jgi:hypothetical protein